MFITVKRHEREKRALAGIRTRLMDAILKSADQGLFLLDGKGKIIPPVSRGLATLFRREDFDNLTLEKLLAPVVSAKTLTVVRSHLAGLAAAAAIEAPPAPHVFERIEVRLPNDAGVRTTAQYAFEFEPADLANEPRAWLVRITDITRRLQTLREVEELRHTVQTQGDILRGILHMGGPRFGAFLIQTDASMQSIAAVLKKSARTDEAFRGKAEETLETVDRIRREAAVFKQTALENAARGLADALHDLRKRDALSAADLLPLAVKLDDLSRQFALVRSLTAAATPAREVDDAHQSPVTDGGTQIMAAPSFARPAIERTSPAGSLQNTLQALTEHIAEENDKPVRLESSGLELVPSRHQATVKNVAIQLIRNAVMHGIEAPELRAAAGKAPHGTLRLEVTAREEAIEILFEDDGCGIDPERVRSTAVMLGMLSSEDAARLHDREAIKLIFKSRFTTLASDSSPGSHGSGMSLVRRHVYDAGGKIALASLPGHETRFKITLPDAPVTA
jgi:signal transduction histidine kinase